MQWNKFSNKNNSSSVARNNNNLSQHENSSSSTMRRTVRNDKIDAVHDRRNKYLGNHHGSVENSTENAIIIDRQKPYSKHLMPLSPNGSVGRLSALSPGGMAINNSVPNALEHPLKGALSPGGGRGGIKPLGSIDHDKHKARLAGIDPMGLGGKPVERFRNLEPINKFQWAAKFSHSLSICRVVFSWS